MAQPIAPRDGTILLVEDCAEVRMGLAELLELNGFHVNDTADGEHAIRTLSADPAAYALLLLDLILPGRISGTDIRAQQLSDPRLAAVPTVVVSACEPEEDVTAILKPDVWLEKPLRCEQLLAVVRRFVRPVPRAGAA